MRIIRFCHIFLILFLFSCSGVKSPFFNKIKTGLFSKFNIKKKTDNKIIAVFEKDYSSTVIGRLSKKILIDFFKKNKIKNYGFKTVDRGKINFKEPDMQIAALDMNYARFNIGMDRMSNPVMSRAVYFLIHPENFKGFDNDLFNRMNGMKKGVLFGTYGYSYVTGSFNPVNNYYYKDKDNMISDFKMHKIDLLVIDRQDLYENIYTLPYISLYYIDYGEPYGNIYFRSSLLKEKFNAYLNARKYRFEWLDIIYIKPDEIKYIENYIRKLDIDLNRKL